MTRRKKFYIKLPFDEKYMFCNFKSTFYIDYTRKNFIGILRISV